LDDVRTSKYADVWWRLFRRLLAGGLIETPLWHTPGEPYPPTLQRWAEMTPLGRADKADEVARLALFLASDEASFITGQDIAIDGGFCVGMRFEVEE
jgi:NAD(P)-dependent dehydrogenase (short-subunit alcohol dehydrogenase family)